MAVPERAHERHRNLDRATGLDPLPHEVVAQRSNPPAPDDRGVPTSGGAVEVTEVVGQAGEELAVELLEGSLPSIRAPNGTLS